MRTLNDPKEGGTVEQAGDQTIRRDELVMSAKCGMLLDAVEDRSRRGRRGTREGTGIKVRTAAVPNKICRCVERVLVGLPYALYVLCLS